MFSGQAAPSMNQMLITIGVIALVVLLRMGRGMRARKVRFETMWIGPVIVIALAGFVMYADPPHASMVVYGSLFLAVLVGLVVGWARGRIVTVTIDTETHELTSQMSPWGMLVLLAIIALRMGLRYALSSHMEQLHLSATLLTDGFLVFYVGMICGRQAEIFLRCMGLLAQAKAAKAAGQTVETVVTQDHA
jgi:hypothetical protein